jgi:DNA-binding response OmpR family regulator
VGKVRRKIEGNSSDAAKYIKTIKNQCYMFVGRTTNM